MAVYTILLVPSTHFYWIGLEALLRAERELRVLDPARDADAATRAAAAQHPTFIAVAADLDGAPLVALAGELHARSPRSKLILIGPLLEHEEQMGLLGLRIACHMCWAEVSPERMRCTLELVRDADMRVASGAVADQLMPPDRRRRVRAPGLVLTERERAVMAGLAAGQTQEEIAARTHLGLRTVKRTIAVLCETFDAPTAFVLGMQAALHGFVPAPWPDRPTKVARLGHGAEEDGPFGP